MSCRPQKLEVKCREVTNLPHSRNCNVRGTNTHLRELLASAAVGLIRGRRSVNRFAFLPQDQPPRRCAERVEWSELRVEQEEAAILETFSGPQETPLAVWQCTEADGPDPDPFQAQHAQIDGLAHPADLAMPPLAEHET